jgi:hypothetical protein
MSGISTRELVKKAYPNSIKWSKKVDNMTDGQVTAIFFRLRKEGKI